MQIVVIDANVLLQCRSLNELPWQELSESLRVVVPFAVIKEVDALKGDGNSRRAQRARKASALFAQALRSRGEKMPLSGTAPRTWELGSGRMREHPALSPSEADDRLVAEALALADEVPVMVLSGDTIVRYKAMLVGLNAEEIPDTWRLPPEPNDSERRLAAMERRLQAIESRVPQLTLRLFVGRETMLTTQVRVTVHRCRALGEDEIDELVAIARERRPMATEEAIRSSARSEILSTNLLSGRPPGKFEIYTYQNVLYPQWVEEVRTWIGEYVRWRNDQLRTIALRFELSNNGTVPADGLLLEYEASSDALLAPSADDDDAMENVRPPFPRPPTVPRAADDRLSTLTTPYFPNIPESRLNRDRYQFYPRFQTTRPEPILGFECGEFRHGSIQSFDVAMLVPTTSNSGRLGLTVRATARNLPEPWHQVTPAFYTVEEFDLLPELRQLVDPPRKPKKKPGVTLRLDIGKKIVPGAADD
ncbi:PIN domain-containing protein [Tahibacter soli]|uniref:PIN domain-containing protein n=1 Tax=Tahibacter soli TaxID=2983605 RepID=A0A9X4BHF8_9GAMM|nr:PIN domain-containing protein [Tahibacter soli]MDC8012791.1 PIN domain-containing protein [Tahibacter soli]